MAGGESGAAREDPVLRAEADAIEAEYGGLFKVTVRFGGKVWRADRAGLPPGAVAAHFEGGGAEELRQRLDAATGRARRGGDRKPTGG